MNVLGGCATRPVNPPVGELDPGKSHRVERPSEIAEDNATLVVLAFSGGGTRAAAFSFGVLETLRDMEGTTKSGRRVRLVDTIDVITGISGGSFTALAYGLHGDKLFDLYEQSFLKRDVQGELLGRALSPANWPTLASTGWGRSELAANLYDEILFNGATYKDLRRDGPRIHEGPVAALEGASSAVGSYLAGAVTDARAQLHTPESLGVLEEGFASLLAPALAPGVVDVLHLDHDCNRVCGALGWTGPDHDNIPLPGVAPMPEYP